MSGRPLSVRNVAHPRCKYNNNLQYSKYPNHIFFLNKTLSFATTYGGNVISHQETNKATTMAVTLVTELQNFICPQQEFVSRSFFFGKANFLFSSIPLDITKLKQTPILLMGGIGVCYDGFLPWELACGN